MWKVGREDSYLRIYDRRRDVAGYFDPDYGDIVPREREEEVIESMWRNRDPVPGGHLMVGLAKLGILGGDYSDDLDGLEGRLAGVSERIAAWRDHIREEGIPAHYVGVSHTDQDMLTMTVPVRFPAPAPLEERGIAALLSPALDALQRRGLL